jgi:hypothetical protein
MTAIATSQASRVGRALVRNFTGLWFTLLAALPVIATEFGVIPMYDSQRRLLPACASFFCFLGFACIFSLRHVLARAMFGSPLLTTADSTHARPRISINYLPTCLILASLGAAATYLWAFESGRGLPTFPASPRSSADAVVLALSFVAMFLFAETAFTVMAVREYLQDMLGLSDAAIITGVSSRAEPKVPDSDSQSLAVSYRVVPRGSSNEEELAEFNSELDDDIPERAQRVSSGQSRLVRGQS